MSKARHEPGAFHTGPQGAPAWAGEGHLHPSQSTDSRPLELATALNVVFSDSSTRKKSRCSQRGHDVDGASGSLRRLRRAQGSC